MSKEQEIICIMCPKGCLMKVAIDGNCDVLNITNNQCKEGEKYARAECKFPGRILTTTILAEGSLRKLLPARTNQPIPRGQLMDTMYFLSEIKVKPPIKAGQVIIRNLMKTGADLVATDDLLT